MSVQALSAAFAVRGLSASEKLVLLALSNYAGPTMSCWPAQDTLADDTELSARTVWAALKALEDRGLIGRQSRKRADGTRATDVFTLHFQTAQPLANPANTTRKVCETHSQSLHEPVATVASPTTFEPAKIEPGDDDVLAGEPDWNTRLKEAWLAGGDGLDRTATALHVYRDLKSLCEGPEPCEWDEVLDAIRVTGAAAKAKGRPMRSWLWVKDPALGFRDRRIAGLPAPRAIIANATGPPSSRDEKISASWDYATARIAADEQSQN